VHGPTEVAFWSRVPVVASSPWPRRAAGEGDLLADLRQALPDDRASLVVAASEAERGAAASIARGLDGSHHESDEIVEIGSATLAEGTLAAVTPSLRRDARAVERVLIVVESGKHPIAAIAALTTRIGRDVDVNVVVVGVEDALLEGPDRVGMTRAVA
jgi:hypothetical protein